MDRTKMVDDYLASVYNGEYERRIGDILIEADGEQHFYVYESSTWHTLQENMQGDKIRDDWVHSQNKYKLIRIPYDVPDEGIYQILEEIVNTQNLSATTIEKYHLAYIDKDHGIDLKYYTRLNSAYEVEYTQACGNGSPLTCNGEGEDIV